MLVARQETETAPSLDEAIAAVRDGRTAEPERECPCYLTNHYIDLTGYTLIPILGIVVTSNSNSKDMHMTSGRLFLALVVVLMFTVAWKPAFAQKVQTCHRTGHGTFHLISIDSNAVPAHVAHGDGSPGDAVPNMSGFIFGPDCTPIAAPPADLPAGCYTLVNNPPFIASVDILYSGTIDILGNVTAFFDSTDGTCSGGASPDPFDGVIAAANATEAQSKCDALAGGSVSLPVSDLGAPTGFRPSAPGFWFCSTFPPF